MLVCSMGRNNSRKVKLRNKSRRRGGVRTEGQVHLDIEVTSKYDRAVFVSQLSQQVRKLFHKTVKRNVSGYAINTTKYKIKIITFDNNKYRFERFIGVGDCISFDIQLCFKNGGNPTSPSPGGSRATETVNSIILSSSEFFNLSAETITLPWQGA